MRQKVVGFRKILHYKFNPTWLFFLPFPVLVLSRSPKPSKIGIFSFYFTCSEVRLFFYIFTLSLPKYVHQKNQKAKNDHSKPKQRNQFI